MDSRSRSGFSRRCFAVALSCALFVLVGCPDDKIFVTRNPDNEPPTVVRQGPDFPTDPVDGSGLRVWVLAGDPDGLEDISAVLLSIERIRINDLIIRPDADDGGCAGPLYEPNNIIDTTALFSLPVEISGPRDLRMVLEAGGIYSINPFSTPGLAESFAAFGSPSGCASGPPSWLQWVVLLPPAVPSATSVFLTFIDVEFIGVSVTLYDASGETATTTFPDLRMIRTTPEEMSVAP